MRASHALRWLAGGILVLWCGVFLRMETTEKSMVRALIVQPNRSGWAVQLLYQFPEAAADASDAVAEIRSCSAEDATLPLALHKAERELPKAANYRLCEYLLFDETASQTDVLELEEFLQTESVSRLSARVLFVAGIGKLAEETPPAVCRAAGRNRKRPMRPRKRFRERFYRPLRIPLRGHRICTSAQRGP